jgi:hypothetical protein
MPPWTAERFVALDGVFGRSGRPLMEARITTQLQSDGQKRKEPMSRGFLGE